ncbi:MAG: glycosyltransferase family 2 protein [Candidatus Omnitrophica bacterium]|nr:glycosyltransferase family 2 protein [Candidatus Omnitrophota bacterium]
MDIVCDLVLLSWNHLEETQPCLESLFRCTTATPSRLIIVDNGSEPPVREFLRSVRPRNMIREVVLLQNEQNEGFPRGMNRGIQASRAPYVCLLNNDLLFTSKWLIKLIEVAEAHPELGVLNPESSTFGNVPPPGMSLDEYAECLERRRGAYVEVGMCIGFCLLIRREVIARIGGLTEEVERIFFEDEDYCMRAQAAGFRCAVAQGSYVHHAEHKTVSRMGEREAIFSRNQRWCHEKWGKWLRIAYPRLQPPVPSTEETRQWLEQLIRWARRRAHVYVYCPRADGVTKDALFHSVGLVPHADIHWSWLPARGSAWVATWRIVKRQKKRFDAIVIPEERWAAGLKLLRPVHRAPVTPISRLEALEPLWQTRHPSLLSS